MLKLVECTRSQKGQNHISFDLYLQPLSQDKFQFGVCSTKKTVCCYLAPPPQGCLVSWDTIPPLPSSSVIPFDPETKAADSTRTKTFTGLHTSNLYTMRVSCQLLCVNLPPLPIALRLEPSCYFPSYYRCLSCQCSYSTYSLMTLLDETPS